MSAGALASGEMIGASGEPGEPAVTASNSVTSTLPASANVAFADRNALITAPKVVAEYKAMVDRVNSELANFEQMKHFRLVPDEWTLESGELTPSLKLKRRVIQTRYAAEIESFYRDEAVPRE